MQTIPLFYPQTKTKKFALLVLQNHLHKIEERLNEWRIKVIETKSVQVNFTNRRRDCPPVSHNNHQLLQRDEAKYHVP